MDEPQSLPEDTQSLALNAQAGDTASFNELYQRLVPALHSWASLRIHARVRSRLEPEDVVQETFVRAYRLFPEYDGTTRPFRRWLFAIAKFVLLEQIKKTKALHLSTTPTGDTRADWINDCPDDITSLTQRIARDDVMTQFLESVAQLPEDERRIVMYCGLEGLTAAEAGEKLGIGAEALAKRWQRLRQRMRTLGFAKEWMA